MDRDSKTEDISSAFENFDRAFRYIDKVFEDSTKDTKELFENDDGGGQNSTDSADGLSSDDGPEESDVGNAQKTGCFEPLVQLSERIKLLLRRKK